MNAPPFPTNPSVGEWFGSWVWNGARWVCGPSAGVRVITTVFTSDGPYQPSPGLVSLVVECIGGGGAGGFVTSAVANQFIAGGGGGSGGYSRKTLAAALVAGGVVVTVGGGGGLGGTGGTGGEGAPTSFGAFCVANPGMGGGANDATNYFGISGLGATPGIGDIAWPGASGQPGELIENIVGTQYSSAQGGIGGHGMAGGTRVEDVGVGGASTGLGAYNGTGAGGSGACVNQKIDANVAGGPGGSGICIVTEYCWADVNAAEDCLNPAVKVDARVAVTNVPWPGDPCQPGPCPPGWGQLGYDP